jgi:hypothetical protein
MEELAAEPEEINSGLPSLPDRRPSETFSLECAGQPTRKRTICTARDSFEPVGEAAKRLIEKISLRRAKNGPSP